jgi:opacity protein-like surface antigen
MKAPGLAAALLICVAPTAAFAQDGWKGDIFAGYSVLAAERETMHGGHAALGWGLAGRIGLLLDASRHQGTEGEGTDVSVVSLMAGPSLTFGGGRLRPFAHVIAGAVRTKASVSVFDVEISESSTDFGGAAGGGFDWGFGERWAARFAGDYRVLKVGEETAGDPRLSAGVSYRFGLR